MPQEILIQGKFEVKNLMNPFQRFIDSFNEVLKWPKENLGLNQENKIKSLKWKTVKFQICMDPLFNQGKITEIKTSLLRVTNIKTKTHN